MLPKKHRLNLDKERFFKGDFEENSAFFKLTAKKVDSDATKIGFIVSGKVGKATVRNSVRRKLSEAVHKRLDSIPPRLAIIIIAFPKAATAKESELGVNLERMLSKLDK